ncbi:ABC transporter permease [Aquabacterium sp.]|uniref:ABC transporter permease n=1 Tax=Aquabacterium sp. TaxID=1872578 RepID=UPI0035B14D82
MSASSNDIYVFKPVQAEANPSGSQLSQLAARSFTALRPLVSHALIGLVCPLLLFGLWWLTAERQWIAEQILPSPAFVWQSFRDVLDSGELIEHVGHSLRRAALSLLIGGSSGVLLGLAMGLSPTFKAYVFPTFKALAQVPVLGWIPLLIIFVGIDEALKLSAISIAVVVPVTLTILDGIANIPRALIEVGRVYRFSLTQRVLRIVLPAAAPSLFTALRQGVMQAWLTVIFVELLSSSEGLGFFMAYSRSLSQIDMVIVSMLTIGALGIVIELALRGIELRVQRWRRPAF